MAIPKSCESEDTEFSNSHVTWPWSRHQKVIWLYEGSQGKSAPFQVWCPWFFCKWDYNNVFNLSRDFTRPPQFRGHANVLVEAPHGISTLDKSCDHRRRDRGDMFSICKVTHGTTCLKDYLNLCVTTLPCLVVIGLVQVEIHVYV